MLDKRPESEVSECSRLRRGVSCIGMLTRTGLDAQSVLHDQAGQPLTERSHEQFPTFTDVDHEQANHSSSTLDNYRLTLRYDGVTD